MVHTCCNTLAAPPPLIALDIVILRPSPFMKLLCACYLRDMNPYD